MSSFSPTEKRAQKAAEFLRAHIKQHGSVETDYDADFLVNELINSNFIATEEIESHVDERDKGEYIYRYWQTGTEVVFRRAVAKRAAKEVLPYLEQVQLDMEGAICLSENEVLKAMEILDQNGYLKDPKEDE